MQEKWILGWEKQNRACEHYLHLFFVLNIDIIIHIHRFRYAISFFSSIPWWLLLIQKHAWIECSWPCICLHIKGLFIVSSVGPPCFCVSKIKPLRISCFQGRTQNDNSGSRANWLRAPKTSVGLEESGDTHNVPFSYASEAGDNLATSSAFHGLFKKWLKMLRTQSSCQEVEEVFGRPTTPTVLPETLQMTHSKDGSEVLKLALSHFLALDAAITIPLLIL